MHQVPQDHEHHENQNGNDNAAKYQAENLAKRHFSQGRLTLLQE
jgi:hypothetical protein